MRNGNCDAIRDELNSTVSSYRTYEEWKLIVSAGSPFWSIGSYRTYEEWKLTIVFPVHISILVLTVPMRNGNEFRHLFFRLLD